MSAAESYTEPPRYEIKFLFRAAAYDTLRFLLRTHSAGLHTAYAPRVVQSIYFDTANSRAAVENISGQSSRQKLRFRWYGAAAESAIGALEIKARENVLISKVRAPLLEPLKLRGQTRRAMVEVLRRASPLDFQALLSEGLEPAQWIRYERDYFTTRDGRVRVTLDRHLRAWDLRDRFVVSNTAPTPLDDHVVVECKALPENYDALQDVANALPATRTRCSKYVMALLPNHYGA